MPSNTFILSDTLSTRLFQISSRVESCQLDTTWRHFSYHHQNHLKHLYTKSHSVDSTIPVDESCRLVTTRDDLTTFYRAPSAMPSNTFIRSLTLSTRLFQMSSRVDSTRLDSTRLDDILQTTSTMPSNTIILSLTLSTRLFQMSSRVESCQLDTTWRHFSYPHQNHLKHFYTKWHSVDSTIPNVESCWLESTRHDLTTFYRTPPQCLTSCSFL